MATRWLTQHQLGHLPLVGDLHQLFGDIAAARADDLSPQVFSEHGMLFQATPRSLALLWGVLAILEKADKSSREGAITLWLDRDGDQIRVQSVGQPPGIADDLAGMGSGIEAHQDSLAGRPQLVDPVLGHVLLELRL